MKFTISKVMLVAVAATTAIVTAETSTTTTTQTRNLRGKVVHTRTVPQKPNSIESGGSLRAEPLVDPQRGQTVEEQGDIGHHETMMKPPKHHHYVTLSGKNSKGNERSIVVDLDKLEDKLPHDAAIFKKHHHVFHNEESTKNGNMRGGGQGTNPPPSDQENHLRTSPHDEQQDAHYQHHRADHDIHHHHHETHEHHFEGHVEVERHHEHHYHPHHYHKHHHAHHKHQYSLKNHPNYDHEENDDDFDWKQGREMYKLPTGLSSHFNETLFEELHDAPFRVYEDALGHSLEEGESFPVFALPQWLNTTGVFTGFSKTAAPLIFENVQFLLHWNEIVSAVNSPVGQDLTDHIAENNFHASLIIGKSVGNGARIPFIGMVVCYYQFGAPKNVLVPFSKLEDFFDDTSEKHLLDPDTKSLEMAALHDMLEQTRSNNTSSNFYHPALAHTEERKTQLEDLEITHFQKLFQLLIRRSFLFSFGYADCLLNEPHDLRYCLDDTFYSLIKMETSVRGALDDQIIEQLSEINETFHSKVSEACISVQGSGTGMMYGTGSCYSNYDLGAFVGNYGSF